MTEFNRFQTLKRRFFAMRNGIIADAVRKSGAPYPLVFGLNLPQIRAIADEFPVETELADQLWADSRCRESLLMAPMVHPREEMTAVKARRWLEESPSAEVTDILCHRLLRHLPDAMDIAVSLADSDRDLTRYGALRLMLNLIGERWREIEPYVKAEQQRGCDVTDGICRRMTDEIEFFKEGE